MGHESWQCWVRIVLSLKYTHDVASSIHGTLKLLFLIKHEHDEIEVQHTTSKKCNKLINMFAKIKALKMKNSTKLTPKFLLFFHFFSFL